MKGLFKTQIFLIFMNKKMRKLLITILIALFFGLRQGNVVRSAQVFYGTANSWQDYTAFPNAIFIDVSFPQLNLQNPPFVTTFLTCSSQCWEMQGTTSIYKLTPTGFRVYLRNTHRSSWTVQDAIFKQFVLNYKLEAYDP